MLELMGKKICPFLSSKYVYLDHESGSYLMSALFFRTRWGKMSNCLGSYCYIKVGATISDVETLMEPINDSHTDKVLSDLCLLGNFHAFVVVCWLFSKVTFFNKKIFLERYHSVKQFGSRSRRKFCRSWFAKLFAKVISRQQKSPLARKELSGCISAFSDILEEGQSWNYVFLSK